MHDRLSDRIVSFIAGLLPLYVNDAHDGIYCARSLVDGTLILPMAADEDSEDGFVEVHWQGDASRSSIVQGVFVASVAVARYIELHAIPEGKQEKSEFQHMSNHFTVKTGASLVFEADDSDAELYRWIGRVADRVGVQAVIEILKKSMGLM
jgi:hypothetical protein